MADRIEQKRKARGKGTNAFPAILLVLLLAVSLAGGCGGGDTPAPVKPGATAPGAAKPGTAPAATANGPMPTRAPGCARATASGANIPAKPKDLIIEAGFDKIYPSFRKDIGRLDPFKEVSLSVPPIDVIRKSAPEKFRVIGTAMTPSGRIAMVDLGGTIKVIHQGDVLENGTEVTQIDDYNVNLEKDGRKIRLAMFTRKVASQTAEQVQYPALPVSNVNNLYSQYLTAKFDEKGQVKGKDTGFNDFYNGKDAKSKSGATSGGGTTPTPETEGASSGAEEKNSPTPPPTTSPTSQPNPWIKSNTR